MTVKCTHFVLDILKIREISLLPVQGETRSLGSFFYFFIFFYVSCITEDLQKIMPVSHKQSRAFLRLVQTALSSGCGVFPKNADTARLPS